MAFPRQFRSAAAWAVAMLLAVVCGQFVARLELPESTGGTPDHGRLATPRPIDLPPAIRPLLRADIPRSAIQKLDSVPAQYEQPSGNSNPSPRIVHVATSPTADSSVISEPGLVISEPAAARTESPAPSASPAPQPTRSQFIPLDLPEATPAPTPPAAPELPQRPDFSESAPVLSPPARSPLAVAEPQPTPNAPWPSAKGPAVDCAQPFSNETNAAPIDSRPPPPAAAEPPPDASPRSSQFLAPPVGPSLPRPSADAMQAVQRRAMEMADQAANMAQRGMLFSARSELIKSLQLVAQALDVQEGGDRHTAALAAGLVALDEAREFTAEAGRPGETIQVAAIAARHRAALFTPEEASSVSPIVAQQRYFAFAQEQMAIAAGQSGAASQILYRLGRLQTAMAAHDSDALALHGPRAMVFHQAALTADASNYLAANELGVLLARYGQLADARRLLVQSVSIHPHSIGWQNLAVVHRRLGENDLADLADRERKLLDARSPAPSPADDMVRWVDAKTFAASQGGDVHWPDATAARTAASSTNTTRR